MTLHFVDGNELKLNWRFHVNVSLNIWHESHCSYPAGNYMFKVNNRNTRKRCEICSKLTINTSKWRHWRRSGVFIVNFEHISHCSSASVVNFEHVIACRLVMWFFYQIILCQCSISIPYENIRKPETVVLQVIKIEHWSKMGYKDFLMKKSVTFQGTMVLCKISEWKERWQILFFQAF